MSKADLLRILEILFALGSVAASIYSRRVAPKSIAAKSWWRWSTYNLQQRDLPESEHQAFRKMRRAAWVAVLMGVGMFATIQIQINEISDETKRIIESHKSSSKGGPLSNLTDEELRQKMQERIDSFKKEKSQ